MSVSRCRICHRDYWRYPGAPPPRFCSLQCKEHRKQAAIKTPQELLALIRFHLKDVHQTTDIMACFPACEFCNSLDAHYASALAEVSHE